MPKHLWGYALNLELFIYNRLPHSRLNFKTPHDLLVNRKPDLKYLRRFGSLAYVYNPKIKLKLDEKSKRGFLIKCTMTSYILFQPETGKFITSKDVVFIESKVLDDHFKWDERKRNFIDAKYEGKKGEANFLRNEFEHDLMKEVNDDDYINNEIIDEVFQISNEPNTYEEAIKGNEKQKWTEGVKDELDSLIKNGTWEYVKKNEIPHNTKILRSKWIFNKKIEANGKVRYKGRVVVLGYGGENQYDTIETYSPVARISDVRFVLSIVNKFDLELHQMNVKTAFLYGGNPYL